MRRGESNEGSNGIIEHGNSASLSQEMIRNREQHHTTFLHNRSRSQEVLQDEKTDTATTPFRGIGGTTTTSTTSTTTTTTTTTVACQRIFVIVSALVILHKVAICIEFLNLHSRTATKLFWIPSLFLQDLLFLALLYYSYFGGWSPSRRITTILPICVFLTIGFFTTTIIVLNLIWLILNDQLVPWEMTAWAVSLVLSKRQYMEAFKAMLIETTTKISLNYGFIFTLFLLLLLCTRIIKVKCSNENINKQLKRNDSDHYLLLPTVVSSATKRVVAHPTRRYKVFLLCIVYFVLTTAFRPKEPYQKISNTPFISVPIDIVKGYYEYNSNNDNGKNVPSTTNATLLLEEEEEEEQSSWKELVDEFAKDSSKVLDDDDKPLNLVLVFLESVRSDMMPFDNTAEWAKRFLIVNNNNNEAAGEGGGMDRLRNHHHHRDRIVTPFYNDFVKDPSTLHIPLMKSASGYTSKSLLSTLCSIHAMAEYHTREHKSKLYNPCLPKILERFGYKSKFFQSSTGTFDNQREVMENIGFSQFFAQENFDQTYNITPEFKDIHSTNYFGYDDDVFLKPMMDWVDKQRKKETPFFLSYLTGVTHDPYNIPPRQTWDPKTFSNDGSANGYLNGIAYTDEFLRKLISNFESRDLLDSTLFVFVGDHGGDFADRGPTFKTWSVPFEEAFNVGASFHTKRQKWTQEFGKVRNTKGPWSSIDIAPTILEMLLPGLPKTVLDGREGKSLVDGRSILSHYHQSSLRRLLVSIPNPGCGMILRDGSYSIITNCDEGKSRVRVYDLNQDPGQKTRLFLAEDLDASSVDDIEKRKLLLWGEKAFHFLTRLKKDLITAHETGIRCENCALSSLLSLESLSD